MMWLVACSTSQGAGEDSSSYPKPWKEQQAEKLGRITGDGGITLFGKGKSSDTGHSVNVNAYLWRAALDSVHKMPLISADPFGGVILTDWYKATPNSKERYKLSIYIIGAQMRSDAVRVAAFKQELKGNGEWQDVDVGTDLASEVEDKILLRARAIKYSE